MENELADNKYSEYLMRLFKNRDLQSKKDKKAGEKSLSSKTETGENISKIVVKLMTHDTHGMDLYHIYSFKLISRKWEATDRRRKNNQTYV